MIIHGDNARLHVAKCVTEYMDQNSLKRAPHPPYLPDLAPSDVYIFGYVKHQSQGHEFTKGAELVSAISENLESNADRCISWRFDDWMRGLQRFIDVLGGYVE
jgi:hypothetical protein